MARASELGKKGRRTRVFSAKLSKSGKIVRSPTFDACGRVIVARGGNPDGSPSHSPSLRCTFYNCKAPGLCCPALLLFVLTRFSDRTAQTKADLQRFVHPTHGTVIKLTHVFL